MLCSWRGLRQSFFRAADRYYCQQRNEVTPFHRSTTLLDHPAYHRQPIDFAVC
jgi:hypothetical protein